MCDNREAAGKDQSVAAAAERRQWERYPSAYDTVIIAGGAERHAAVVVNVSATGMGLKTVETHDLTKGQVVTVDGLSGPVQAVIRHTTADDEGASYVGVEWCE